MLSSIITSMFFMIVIKVTGKPNFWTFWRLYVEFNTYFFAHEFLAIHGFNGCTGFIFVSVRNEGTGNVKTDVDNFAEMSEFFFD